MGCINKSGAKSGSIFMHTMDSDVLSKMVRFPDKPFIKKIMTLSLPKVDLSTKIYIPLVDSDTLGHESYLDSSFPKIATKELNLPFKVKNKKYDPEKFVKVKIISKKDWKKVNWKTGKLKKPDADPATVPAIVIFIHGGGFVVGNTSMYQDLLRRIAREANYPIFSIDYRLAPDYPYPYGLNDGWQAYLWIVYYARDGLQLKFDKVILCGDSAGGNLIGSVTNLAILKKCRIPDGLQPMYPGLNLSRTNFVPSMLNGLDDALLNMAFLDFGVKSYDTLQNADKDFLISPCMIPDKFMLKDGFPIYPPVRFVISGNDPLRDEGLKFLIKLCKLGIDAKVFDYQHQMHGFLMFLKGPMCFDDAKDAISKCAECIQELVGLGNNYSVVI